ncbi:hypothetical protein [Clostridium sp.]|uniref:hypothetical protein n=1 Tax=Clostridium sp. TaxID=1506 RepID=UPI0026274C32|nr:hypothetical protein [Clostridium sp.]
MDFERLNKLVKKIYEEGLFCIDEKKSAELLELESITDYKEVFSLFYSDLAPDYVSDTIKLYEEIKEMGLNKERYIKMIDKLINNLNEIKQFELELYCMFIEEKFNLQNTDVYDLIFELSDEGLNAIQIYDKLCEGIK